MNIPSDRSQAGISPAISFVSAATVAGLALLTILLGFEIVPAGYRGVKTRFGRVVGKSLEPGLNFQLPLIERILSIEVREQKLEQRTSASSKDLQTVQTTIAVNFHPQESNVHQLYEEIGPEYQERVLHPAVEETVKAVTAKYTAEELITKRTEVRSEMQNALSERVLPNHIQITKFNIVNFEFSSSFNEAIEAKQTAEQEALKAQNVLRRIRVEAEQKIEQARGAAESVKLAAEAEASAIRLRAQAEAEAQEMLARVVHRDVIRLRAIEKWNGVMPRVASEAVPLLNLQDEEQP